MSVQAQILEVAADAGDLSPNRVPADAQRSGDFVDRKSVGQGRANLLRRRRKISHGFADIKRWRYERSAEFVGRGQRGFFAANWLVSSRANSKIESTTGGITLITGNAPISVSI